jgi:O-antigen/teichoic acid export membrane protein
MVASLIKRGGFAFIIKITAAALQFAMFLALSLAMGADDFGIFGFSFSLATFLAVLGSVGQRMLTLRYLPIYLSEDRISLALGRIKNGLLIIISGTTASVMLSLVVLPLFSNYVSVDVLVATGVFALTIALAEYYSFTLRGCGSIALSLLPRDVLWRLLVIAGAVPFILNLTDPITAISQIYLSSIFLGGTVVLQACLHPLTSIGSLWSKPVGYEKELWRGSTLGLWGVSVIQIAAPNLAVVVIGLILSPEDTGPIFAALRIALLLNLFLLSANMVIAPTVSKLFHSGDLAALQKTCSSIAAASSISAFSVLIFLIFYGRPLLNLFGDNFSSAYWPLLIISSSYVVNTLTGPTSLVLELSGHEKAAFRILALTNVASILAMPPMTLFFGVGGCVLCLSFSIIGWNISAVIYSRKYVGIDPSIFSLIYRNNK